MKKTLSILLALVLAFSLASCGGEKKDEKKDASVVVTGLCEAVKTFDKERIKVLLANSDISLIDQKSALLPEEFLATMKTWAENIEYEIGEITVDDITATASVKFKYSDAALAMTEASKLYNEKVSLLMGADATNGYLGGSARSNKDKETLSKEINEFLLQCLNSGVEKEGLQDIEETVTVPLVKYQGDWKIKNLSDDIFRIMTSNVFALSYD